MKDILVIDLNMNARHLGKKLTH